MLERLSRSEDNDLKAALALAQLQAEAPWSPSNGSNALASCVDRRAFLRGGAGLIGGLAISQTLGGIAAQACSLEDKVESPWGPLMPIPDEATGLPLLRLPAPFRYRSFGWTGDPMEKGIPTPALHDGMAVIRKLGRWEVLVRNHEVALGTAFGNRIYSPGGGGGTSNLVWDRKEERFVSAAASLSGTIRNCSGGLTPWGTWYTCEEVSQGGNNLTSEAGAFRHGYVFEVGPNGGSPEPFPAMGRFSHEAMAVDPKTGIVYETEDGGTVNTDTGSGFYRFLFHVPGRAGKGGKLQMLKVLGKPQFDFQTLGCGGEAYRVEWVTIPKPDPNIPGEISVFQQGLNAGGASFRRLEGCWYGNRKIFFVSTTGGPVGEGQVFEYDPKRETLRIIFASPAQSVLENPDNIVVTPDGSILMCEDNSGATTNDAERLLILSRKTGKIFTLAMNNINFTNSGFGSYVRPESGLLFGTDWRQQEWAGACFSSDGEWLFVNIQTPGITFAITGPWGWSRKRDEDEDDRDPD